MLQQTIEAHPTHDAPENNQLLEIIKGLGRIFWRNCKLHRSHARKLMQEAFGGSDAEGLWSWKEVYDLQESALVFMLPYFTEQMKSRNISAIAALQEFARLQALGLTQTRRTEEAIARQQFSTPLQLGYVASHCARVGSNDVVLEPSAGTGILAQFCKVRGANVVLNELADSRYELLCSLFPKAATYQFNAEHLHDHLPEAVQPSVVVMNPPFSASPRQDRRNAAATGKHVRSGFLRLVPGGRLVLISSQWFEPDSKFWRTAFSGLENQVCVRATVNVAGEAYAKHGTMMDTRLTVIDKITPQGTPISLDLGTEWAITQIEGKTARVRSLELAKVAHLLRSLPPRSEVQPVQPKAAKPATAIQPAQPKAAQAKAKAQPKSEPQPTATNPGPFWDDVIDVAYVEVPPATTQTQAVLYEVYQPQRIAIKGAQKHPTTLCESVALSAVRPPMSSYRLSCRKRSLRACSQKLSSKASSMQARPTANCLAASTKLMRPLTRLRLPAVATRTPCSFGAVGSSATAPAAAKAVKWLVSFWTTGSRGARKPCGCPSLTSCSKMRGGIGKPLVVMSLRFSRSRSSNSAATFRLTRGFCSRPMPPCGVAVGVARSLG